MKATALILLFLLYIGTGYTQTTDSISYRDIYNFDVGDEFHYFNKTTESETYTKIKIESINYPTNNSVDYETIVENETYNLAGDTQYYSLNSQLSFGNLNSYFKANNTYHRTCGLSFNSTQYCISDSDSITASKYNNRKCYQHTDSTINYYGEDKYKTSTYVAGLGNTLSNYYRRGYGYSAVEFNIKELLYYKKGSETWGTPITFKTKTDSLLPEKKYDKLAVYPNPTSSELILEIPEEFHVNNITVYTIQGKLIKSQNIVSQNMDISELPIGMYILHFTSDDGQRRKTRIVKK